MRYVASARWVWQELWDAIQAFNRHECFDRAAVIGYYLLFSVFPLLLGMVAITGALLVPVQEEALAAVAQALPGAGDAITATVRTLIADRGAIGIVSLLSLLWSARAVFGAMRRGLNAVWEVSSGRAFHRQLFMDIMLVIAAIVLLAGSIAAAAVFSLVARLGGTVGAGPLLQVAAVAIPPAAGFGVFTMLYIFVPNLRLHFADIWPGALVATILFELARTAFVLYVSTFANYASVYGPLASVIALLVWAWVAGVVLLFGAEIASQHYQRRARAGVRDAELA